MLGPPNRWTWRRARPGPARTPARSNAAPGPHTEHAEPLGPSCSPILVEPKKSGGSDPRISWRTSTRARKTRRVHRRVAELQLGIEEFRSGRLPRREDHAGCRKSRQAEVPLEAVVLEKIRGRGGDHVGPHLAQHVIPIPLCVAGSPKAVHLLPSNVPIRPAKKVGVLSLAKIRRHTRPKDSDFGVGGRKIAERTSELNAVDIVRPVHGLRALRIHSAIDAPGFRHHTKRTS